MRDFLDIGDLPEDSLGHIFVDTTETKAIFRAFDNLMREPRTATNGKGVPVLGPPRCGKTSLVQEYLSRCQVGDTSDRKGEAVSRRPLKYLYVRLLPATRLNTIPSQTLYALGHPAPTAGRHDTTQTSDVIRMIIEGCYDVVIYDEIHHLMSSETLRVRQNGSHWLTSVLDGTRCPMILVGYSAFRGVLNENGFLGGRLAPAPPLVPYTIFDPASFMMFRVVLRQLEKALGFAQPSHLSEPEYARPILVTCGGRLGLLENYLTQARLVARERQHSCILVEDLRQAAHDVRSVWCGLRFNPFDVSDLEATMHEKGGTFALPDDGPVRRDRK